MFIMLNYKRMYFCFNVNNPVNNNIIVPTSGILNIITCETVNLQAIYSKMYIIIVFF